MLVAALDYDNYLGQIAIGRVFQGIIHFRKPVGGSRAGRRSQGRDAGERLCIQGSGTAPVFGSRGRRHSCGVGIPNISIGDTIAAPESPQVLPSIDIEEPTVMMTFGVNTSPFMGKEGSRCTSRMLRERLFRELRTNVSLRVEETASADEFLVSGRGELHLAILVGKHEAGRL